MDMMLWAVAFLVVTLLIGVPLPFCFGGAVGIMVTFANINSTSLFVWAYYQMINATLIAGPLFILCGGFIFKAQIAKKLLDLAETFVLKIRGGLGLISILTCGFIGAISGSAFSGVAAIGPTIHPKMVEAGYPKGYAASLIAASTILGVLIPPSLTMIVYGWVTGVSVLACFLSTVGPAMIIIVILSIINYVDCKKFKKLEEMRQEALSISVTTEQKRDAKKNRGKKLFVAIPALSMPVIILGGIYGGVFTPSEAAAVAVFVCVLIGVLFYRNLTYKEMYSAIKESVASSGAIMVMMFFTYMLSQTFVLLKLPEALVEIFTSFTDSKIIVLLFINLLLAFLGMVINDATAVVLLAPILIPLCAAFGVHPVQVAAIMVVNLSFGGLTPPYASVLYLTMRITNCTFDEMLPSTLRFIALAYFPAALLTTFVPAISLWLPSLLGLI